MANVLQIRAFVDKIEVGDEVTVIRKDHQNIVADKEITTAVVLEKYPFIVRTTEGDYMNADIYFWNRGRL